MEFSSSLPLDLLALVDPAARGTAPPLGFRQGDAGSASAAPPFELCLELLDPAAPSGETLPLPGNPLPVALDDDTGLEPDSAEILAETLALSLPNLLPPAPVAVTPPAAAIATTGGSAAATLGAGYAATKPAITDPNVTVEPQEQAPTTTVARDATVASEASWLTAMAETLSPEESPAPKTADARAAAPAVAAASTDASAADYASEAAIVAPRGEASAVARRADEPSRVMARDAWRSALAASATGSSAESRTTDSPPTSPALATVTNTAPVGDAGVAQPAPPTAHIATAAHTLPTVAHAGAPTAAADHVLDQGPVDTTAPRWQDAFANRVQWLANQSVGEANIRLNPPDLGTVDVKISLVEDRTFVQLTTHTNAARDELAQSLPRLRELFATSGLELGGASVSTGRDGQARYDGAAADQPQAQRQAFASVGDVPAIAAAPRRALTAASRIDLFA